jgi:hypothetical protein
VVVVADAKAVREGDAFDVAAVDAWLRLIRRDGRR